MGGVANTNNHYLSSLSLVKFSWIELRVDQKSPPDIALPESELEAKECKWKQDEPHHIFNESSSCPFQNHKLNIHKASLGDVQN